MPQLLATVLHQTVQLNPAHKWNGHNTFAVKHISLEITTTLSKHINSYSMSDLVPTCLLQENLSRTAELSTGQMPLMSPK